MTWLFILKGLAFWLVFLVLVWLLTVGGKV